MNKKYTVEITYRDEQLRPVSQKTYSLEDFTQMIQFDQLKIISDIEDIIFDTCGDKPKDEWPTSVVRKFNKTKHKLLDKAGEISRLPKTIREQPIAEQKETLCEEPAPAIESASHWIARVFKEGK